ncbi:MAG: ImmA/IrrE family metallo-endopeptidase [Brevinematales bacterium]|nr:ImmA/IrrE family metallo-endopeptidase [Brevinematales bacterium]
MIRKMSYEDYRRTAYAFIEKVGMNNCTDLPLDIEIMIDIAGHNIIGIHDLRKRFRTKGVVLKTIDGFDIAIDYDHWMGEKDEIYYRATLAEELAHILIHSYLYDKAKTLEDSIRVKNGKNDEEYKIQEQQARNVASFLLLPDWIFNEYVLKHIEKNIDFYKKEYFFDKENLIYAISVKLEKELCLSSYWISNIILYRYPNLLIDKILEQFGNELL